MSNKHNVFISYARRDESLTKDMIEQLSSSGLIQKSEVFMESDTLEPGANWRETLRSTIDSASTVVVLWSKAAEESQLVNYEAGMAEALGKRIIVVLPKDQEGQGVRIPENLNDAQIVKMKDLG